MYSTSYSCHFAACVIHNTYRVFVECILGIEAFLGNEGQDFRSLECLPWGKGDYSISETEGHRF